MEPFSCFHFQNQLLFFVPFAADDPQQLRVFFLDQSKVFSRVTQFPPRVAQFEMTISLGVSDLRLKVFHWGKFN